MYYTYILLCADMKRYVGHTSNLKERMNRHLKGYVPATKGRRPLKIAFYAAFPEEHKAIEFEKYLKTGSGRAFANKHIL